MQHIKAFYQNELSKTSDAFDILYVGISILDNDLLNDKIWAKELFMLSLNKALHTNDFFDILQVITTQDCFNDKVWTRTLFNLALEKVNTRTSLKFIADCIANDYYLGDTQIATIIYAYCSTKLWTFADPLTFLPQMYQELSLKV